MAQFPSPTSASDVWNQTDVYRAVAGNNWPQFPGAPTIGTATGDNAQASVTFTAPSFVGSSAITGYTVTSSPGGLTGTGASSPITVSGLTNGTAYTFTVTATNSQGTGPASAASNSVTPANVDVYFPLVSMLLPGDGTNGAQNNTFLDSSSNTFSITRNGNTTQGSFSPYGSNWSNYFGGSSNYLQIADSSAFTFGSNNFTVELWIYSSNTSLALFIGQNNGNASATSFDIRYDGTTITGYIFSGGDNYSAAGSMSNNAWHHVALVRNGTSLRLYVDGVSASSTSVSTVSVNDSSNVLRIGASSEATPNYYLNGYLSNVRIVKGTAVYTSNFTPSTTPLTAITNTSLLTCQSNRFVDNSTNALAITTTGSPSVQRFSPFSPTASYSTSVIGGSAYFDGASDYLKTTGTVGIANSAFTICCWFYPLNSSVIGLFDSGAGQINVFRNYDVNIIEDQNTAPSVSFAGAYQVNAWNWLCVTKSGTSFTVYINGTSVGTGGCSGTLRESSFTVGAINNGGDGSYLGYISDFQVLNTATIVSVPTAPITNASGKTYLLNFQNAGVIDNAMMNDLETVGNAQISTSVVKFGTGSIYLPAGSNGLYSRMTPNLTIGSSKNFTLECFVYMTAFTNVNTIYSTGSANEYFAIRSSGTELEWGTLTGQSNFAYTFALSTWYHIALVRSSGNTVKCYVNGTQVGSTVTFSAAVITVTNINVGYYPYNTSPLNGYMDEFRITNGYARYTANFTPPTAAFPTL